MSEDNKVIVTNKCWIPEHLVNMAKVKKNYVITRYEEKGCGKCEYADQRHCYLCDTCPAFLGKYKLYQSKKIEGRPYIGLHVGDRLNFIKKAGLAPFVLDPSNIDDRRSRPKLKYEISFTGKLRPHQKDALVQLKENGNYGQLMAPPRSGKTVLAVRFTLRLKLKTLILVHQGDLLDQMLESFQEFSNIKDVEFEHKKQLIGIAKKIEDFSKWPIVLSTYQKFISPKGKIRLEKIKRKFGLVIVDEIHRASSDCFSQVISTLECKYKLGLTATPKRKDCFTAQTLIEMFDGSKVPIKQVVEHPDNYLVRSFNHSLQTYEPKLIHEGHIRKGSKLVRLTYKGVTFVCTPDHEFFSLDRDCYVAVKNLKIGEHLQEFEDSH